MIRTRLVPALLALALAGCGPPEAPEVSDPETVAVFDGGRLSLADVDRAILGLPPGRRQKLAAGGVEEYRRLARRLAAERLLLGAARAEGTAATAAYRGALRDLRRQAFVEQFTRDRRSPIAPPDEAELRRLYEQQRDRYRRPERRHVLHIFRRRTPEADRERLEQELGEVRRQVLAGASFGVLAAEVSDSESRHRQGALGWVLRGQLAPDLERIVFGLEEGVPSAPVATRDGVHLFYVETALEGHDASFEEVRAMLRRQLTSSRLAAALEEWIEDVELPAGSFVATAEELEALLRAGDPQAVVLRVGGHELRLDRFRTRLAAERRQLGPAAGTGLPGRLLRTLADHERIFQHLSAAGRSLDADLERRLERQAERLLIEHARRTLMLRRLARQPERLRAFYDDRRARFSGPLRLRIRRLRIPLSERSAEQMAELEGWRRELDARRADLAEIAAGLDGEIEDLGWRTVAELTAIEPKMAFFAADLTAGRHSPPYRSADALEMLAVEGREEPAPLPFDDHLGQIRNAYLDRHGAELEEEVIEGVLAEAGFRLFEDRLSRLTSGELPAPAPAPREAD